jgi:predicted dehydrogenase
MISSTPTRIGVVGLGGMGSVHANNLDALGAEVVAGADVDPERRVAFEQAWDAETVGDHDELAALDLDAVVVATPNRFHEPAAVAALEAGMDVLVEKPLAHDLASAERIAAAADDADGFCMVGFHNRFCPAASLFQAYRDEGRFGDITHLEANYVRRRGIPGTGSWFTSSDLAGGGALVDIGVHALDFALYLLGCPEVTEVSGVARTEFGAEADYADPDGFGGGWSDDAGTFDVDDSVSAFVRTADGVTISLEVSWAANREPTDEFVVRGTRAGGRLSLGGDTLTTYESNDLGFDHHVDTEHRGSLDPTGHEAEAAAFLDAVDSGAPPEMNTAAEALTVQRVVDAIYRSSETGQAVRPGAAEPVAPDVNAD